jgi:hypothetical protein
MNKNHIRFALTLMTGFFIGCVNAQNHTTVWPYNPDINADGTIGSGDLVGFLPLFGTATASSPEPCIYDGTPWEELFFGLLDGSIILDSAFFSFTATDVATYFQSGCPLPITDTVTVSDWIFFDSGDSPNLSGTWSNGTTGSLAFGYVSSINLYELSLPTSPFINAYTPDGFFGGASFLARIQEFGLPLDVLLIDSNGVSLNPPTLSEWPYYQGDYSNGISGYSDKIGWSGYMNYADDNWSLLFYYHHVD